MIFMELKWLGHSSWKLKTGGVTIYIDPYEGEYDEPADIILSTHHHDDHCLPEKVDLIKTDSTKIIAPPECGKKLGVEVQSLKPGESTRIGEVGIRAVEAYNFKRFRNPGEPYHPKGLGVGYLVFAEGKTIYHVGDSDFIEEMKDLSGIDVMLVPSGGTYTMDCTDAVEAAMDAGFDARDLVDGLVEHLRNLLLVQATPSPERLVGRIADYEKHEGASSTIGEEDLVRLLRIGIEAQASVKWSTQPALIVELALVRMARLTSSVDIADVLKAFADGGSPAPSGGAAGSTGCEAGRSGGGNLKKSAKPAGVASGRATSSSATVAVGDAPGGVTSSATVTVGDAPGGVTSAAAVAVKDAPAGDVEPALWPDVLEEIRRQKPALAAFLNEAVPAAGEGAVLELAVPNGSRFHRDQLKDRGNMRLMERAAGEIFGGRVKFAFTFGEAPQERNSSRRGEVSISEETAEDPVVRKVLDMFGGEIRGSRREEQ